MNVQSVRSHIDLDMHQQEVAPSSRSHHEVLSKLLELKPLDCFTQMTRSSMYLIYERGGGYYINSGKL